MSRKVLVIGATSAIAQATIKQLAARGDDIFLVGRHADRLAIIAADLSTRQQKICGFFPADLNDFSQHAEILVKARETMQGLDTVLIAHGTLSDQKACEQSVNLSLRELSTNCLSVISLLTLIANEFEAQKHGCIAVISSVAGDRGRQSNYVYGTAKAALSTFLSGLRNRLHRSSVQVLDIRPGFVDTPMTKDFKKGLLWAQPDRIATLIIKGMNKRKDVIYAPGFWKWIMRIIKAIPEACFKRLSL